MDVSKQLIYVCCPCYGNGNRASLRQFWSKSVDPKGKYTNLPSMFDDTGSSLLADSFNSHWKTALNLQLNGHDVTLFAMLHNDIVPQDFWLDVLLDELDRTGADVVSAVVPIKDRRGLTSTALDDPYDPWSVYRRLTLKELENIPPTFSATDCAHLSGRVHRPLLINTGCWVCRFDRPWKYHVHFEITNRMVFVRKSGEVIPSKRYVRGDKGLFVSQVMSEDWNFSKQLSILGCDVRATRKVKLSHIGDAPYNNQDLTWGEWEHDEALSHKWMPDPLPGVAGWLTLDEGRFLAKLAEKKDVLEIGSYCGKSTIWMARTANKVYCIDTFESTNTPDGRGSKSTSYDQDYATETYNTYEEFTTNLKRFGVDKKVVIYVGDTRDKNFMSDVTRRYTEPSYKGMDLIFIDGSHDRRSVENDVAASIPLLKSEGVLAFHDYGTDHPGVTETVDRLLLGGWKKIAEVDSLVVLKPPHEVLLECSILSSTKRDLDTYRNITNIPTPPSSSHKDYQPLPPMAPGSLSCNPNLEATMFRNKERVESKEAGK